MNWNKLIHDLQARGLSIRKIAQACDCGAATISDIKLKTGRQPAYALGESLVRLSKASRREIEKILKSKGSEE
jgi:hypothetical protein